MLTAKTTTGKFISLGEHYSKAYLQQLRKKESFYCEQCKERVILKLGTKRIFHFSHEKGSSCTEQYDRESEYHMTGKLKLYEWLKQKGISPNLEPYYPEIKQRADIAFDYLGKTYCIEFQCSTISEEIFTKRTEGYRKLSLQPIWILAAKNINRKKNDKVALSSFHYLFLSRSSANQWYIPSYCPYINQFILVANIVPTSTKNALTQFMTKPLDHVGLLDVLNPRAFSNPSLEEWRRELNRFKTSLLMNPASLKNVYLQEFYSRSLNPQLLPPYVGLPLQRNPIIQDSPFIWQSYIFIDHLFGQDKGKLISFSNVYISILKRIKKNQIKVRNLPMIKEELLPFLVMDYLEILVEMGILYERGKNAYTISKPIIMAKTLDEWTKEEDIFFHSLTISQTSKFFSSI